MNGTQIESRETVREKVAEKLGFNQTSALDLVSRSAYSSEEQYIDAAAKAELERRHPEYQEIRRKLAAEYRERKEAAEEKLQAERYKEIRASVRLWDNEKRAIDAEAAELARRDLAAGRIGASDLSMRIEERAKRMAKERLNQRAQNQLMNELFRSGR